MVKKIIVKDKKYFFDVNSFEIFRIENENKINEIYDELKNKTKGPSIKLKYYENLPISSIGIELTKGCNLACGYCYISAYKNKIKLLSKERFIEILKFLEKWKKHHITMYFAGGGEPLLNFKLLRDIPLLCEKYGFKKCHFDLTTNGTLLTEEKLSFFLENKDRFTINISLDGDESTNDKARIYPDGSGSFKNVFKNIKLLQKKKIDFICKTVILPDNKNILDVFSFFERNKIKFYFTIATNSYDNHYKTQISDLKNFKIQMEKVTEFYVKLISKNHKIFSEKIINDLKRIHYGDINKIACTAGRDGFFIDINGDIYPCSYNTSSKKLSIGSISQGINYEKIKEKKLYAQDVDNYRECKNCWMKYLCAGSCFAIKWLENKNTEKPSKYLCNSLNIYWEAILKLYVQILPHISSGKNINFL